MSWSTVSASAPTAAATAPGEDPAPTAAADEAPTAAPVDTKTRFRGATALRFKAMLLPPLMASLTIVEISGNSGSRLM
eukprot:3115469-Lingulodinium_polyedra.AAC.1